MNNTSDNQVRKETSIEHCRDEDFARDQKSILAIVIRVSARCLKQNF